MGLAPTVERLLPPRMNRTQTWTVADRARAKRLLLEGEHVDTVALELGLDPGLVHELAAGGRRGVGRG